MPLWGNDSSREARRSTAALPLQTDPYPVQTYRLLRRFLRYMPARDVIYLIVKPFLGQKKGATKAEVLSRAVEHADMKDAAAQLTQVNDDILQQVLATSRKERARIQHEAERPGELPMLPVNGPYGLSSLLLLPACGVTNKWQRAAHRLPPARRTS